MIESEKLLKLFHQAVAEPEIELRHSNPLELLVATVLSAQCTDERVNKVTATLFKKYKTAEDYAKADPAIFEQEIKSTGFYKNKARNIVSAFQAIVKQFNGMVPRTMEELIMLPGVGRKTANVVLGSWFKQPAIVVDTHVRRVSRRLGLTDSEDPDQIELDLQKLFPPEKWTKISHQILLFGRYTCKAKSPKCEGCLFYEDCLSKGKW
ncbi:MAG: endonuclease III [Nitrospiria bacterium]